MLWACLCVYVEKSIIITVTAYNTASMELLSVKFFKYIVCAHSISHASECMTLFERAQALSKYAENKQTNHIPIYIYKY